MIIDSASKFWKMKMQWKILLVHSYVESYCADSCQYKINI